VVDHDFRLLADRMVVRLDVFAQLLARLLDVEFRVVRDGLH